MDSQGWNVNSSSNPLLSIFVTLISLTLLYLPNFIFIITPVLPATTALLLILLVTNPCQKTNSQPKCRADDQHIPDPKPTLENGLSSKSELQTQNTYFDQKQLCVDFLEWDVRAPLGVIHEEESESESEDEGRSLNCYLQRQTSLSRCFPESDTDMSSSDNEYPDWYDEICFDWEDDEKNGLIEISLDGNKDFDFEEDNLIEIDISPTSLRQMPAY